MKEDSFLVLTPLAMLLLWLLRRFLDTPTRLPQLDQRLRRLWVPGAVLWLCVLLAGRVLPLSGDLLDDLYVLALLVIIVLVAWRLRSYQPARTVAFALVPFVLLLAATTVLNLLSPKLASANEDTIDLGYTLAMSWLIGLLVLARNQKKRLAAEAQRRAEEAQAQQRIVARNAELEQLVQARTAALRQQTQTLQQALEELQLTQGQLIQAEKMASLGELTAGIAHEIQNPLNFVNNFAEVSTELAQELAEERGRPTRDTKLEAELLSDLKQNMLKINQHGQRAASIVRGMLEHSRASTGERTLTDLNALADEYLRLAYHGLRAKDKTFNATLQTDLAADLPAVAVVPQDLGRVLLNLFTNAFYAVHRRQQQGEPSYAPTVRVHTKYTGHEIEISVQDNGTGIPAAVQQKIFQPFFTTKPAGEGTGLGLSLAHDIVTKGHGGTLSVESRAGEGATFTLRLPR
jgi:two-component system NtrC family sensor kinase